MATNRLFIYDEKTNSAVCIAKQYSLMWSTGKESYIDEWFESVPEPESGITCLQLKTEWDIPNDALIVYEPVKK